MQTPRKTLYIRRSLLAAAIIFVTALAVALSTTRRETPTSGGVSRLRNPTSTALPATTSLPEASQATIRPLVVQYAFQSEVVTLVDPSRSTPARGLVPALGSRTLLTEILTPVGVPGRMPLIVFAHGWSSSPSTYEKLLEAWAAAGYMVAAPTFPDSTDTSPGSPVSNYPDQAHDISFVITSLLSKFSGEVDQDRIAVGGHSDGGTDVALLALNPEYADHRIRAYLSLSGEIPLDIPGRWGVQTPGDLLVVVGTNDDYGLQARSTRVYQTAGMVKALLTVHGGDHLNMYIGSSPQARSLRVKTVEFLDISLRSAVVAPAELATVLESSIDPSIESTVGIG